MEAVVYTAPNEMTFFPEYKSTQQDRDDDVLLKIESVGICGSDMHAWHGHDERRVPPLVLGHEAVGIVLTGPLAGKRVAINPLMTCGDCDFCSSGDEHLCASRELIGMRVPGAFAEKLAIDVVTHGTENPNINHQQNWQSNAKRYARCCHQQ